ncbi:hypothetical protein OG352_34005 [Streptomyces sp. NBC_01485]|uniref:hypothetical protein n=1 Tax=Streptomyces sp. NBC_01485 TaxID=2903884 RepID=UPI002E349353|nr:hypothetical protein [Streptomyces sp. NBC_01485]
MGAMPESVPVRCPACRRERLYTAPSYPCACGAPVTPVLDRRTAPTTVAHRTWDDDWIALRCPACGRRDQWPHPELGCACGTVLRIPVATPYAAPHATREPATPTPSPPLPPSAPAQSARPRTFRPIAIRTARDAVTATALYLNWLGHGDIRRADQRPTSGVGLAARGLLAQVDPSVHPASLRDVECLWLTAMTESADCVYFSLAGYADDARARADQLRVPLFVLDLTGTPQPVNAVADALDARGGDR